MGFDETPGEIETNAQPTIEKIVDQSPEEPRLALDDARGCLGKLGIGASALQDQGTADDRHQWRA